MFTVPAKEGEAPARRVKVKIDAIPETQFTWRSSLRGRGLLTYHEEKYHAH